MEGIEKKQLDKFCRKLESLGWKKLDFNEVKSNLFEDSIIWDIFISKVKELNGDIFERYKKDEDKIIKEINFKLNSASGYEVLDFIKRGILVDITNTMSERIKLIDFENLEKNNYNYIREFVVPRKDLIGNDRADIILFVNGIPLIIVEGKKAIGRSTWYEGVKQLMRYQYEMRNIFKYLQYGVVVADKDYYMPVFDRQKYEEPKNYSQWKVKVSGEYKSNILDFLSPKRFLEVLFYFTFYASEGKIGPRYMQYFAVANKLMKRVEKYLSGESKRNRGLIWHWQGSGKTEEMFFAAFYFLTKYRMKRPLVFVVIDRTQLGKQSSEAFRRFKTGYLDIEVVSSIRRLKSIIKNIDKEFGIKILTIQKFRSKDFENVKPVEKKEILFLIDEAHRSQYGELAAVRKRIFPNAMSFGFTGTPIFKYEKNTFKEFAYPDAKEPEFYLDVYFIEQSIEDGYTVPIVVETVKESYLKKHFTEKEIKELLEKEYMKEGSRIIEALNRATRKYLKKDITRKRVILESDAWIKKTVEEIKHRIRADTEDFRFKAMIVASSRLACVRYKKYMDEVFGPEFSGVVMSYTQNENEKEIFDFKEEMIRKYHTTNMDEINEKIKNQFLSNKDGNPRVLIVTDMLITGFNAPQLKVIYLDKVLFLHRLLQMIARTNRPYILDETGMIIEKRHGLVVDFVGLVDAIQKSVGIYKFIANQSNREKLSKDLSKAFFDPEHQLKILKRHLLKIREVMDSLNKELNLGVDFDDLVKKVNEEGITSMEELFCDVVGKILLHYHSYDPYYDDLVKMIKSLKEVKSIYVSLGAYPEKLKYKTEFLTSMHMYLCIYKKINEGRTEQLEKFRDLMKEVLGLVHSSTEVGNFDTVFLDKIISPREIRPKLKESLAAMEIFKLKNKLEDKINNPIYKEIYDRINRILKRWSNRELTLQDLLEEIDNEKKKVQELEKKKDIRSKVLAYVVQLLKDKGIDFNDRKLLEPIIEVTRKVINEGRLLDPQKKDLERSIKLFTLKLKKNGLIDKNIGELRKQLLDVLTYLVEEEIHEKRRSTFAS